MRQELRLVGSHVYIDRAIGLAALAGKAQIERFIDMIVLPSALDRIALEHFPQQVSPSARAVHFFARHHVAWAHRAAFVAAAFADSDTAFGGAGEVSIVVGKLEIRFWLPRVVICSEP